MIKEYSSGAPTSQQEADQIAMPSHRAGSGTLDHLVENGAELCPSGRLPQYAENLCQGLDPFRPLVPDARGRSAAPIA